MAARGRELEIPQALRELLGWQAVVAHAFRVEAVGLELFVAHRGDLLERARDVFCHGGADREELQAHLVAAGLLDGREHDGGRGEGAGLLDEGASGDHGGRKSTAAGGARSNSNESRIARVLADR